MKMSDSLSFALLRIAAAWPSFAIAVSGSDWVSEMGARLPARRTCACGWDSPTSVVTLLHVRRVLSNFLECNGKSKCSCGGSGSSQASAETGDVAC